MIVHELTKTGLTIELYFESFLNVQHNANTPKTNKLGWLGVTLVTVNVLLSVVYCAVSSVAAPPRHPAPSISNTSNVTRWCARVWFRDMSRTCTSYVLVRESVRTKFTCKKIYLTCALSCHWCVRVKCSGASDPVARYYKRDWKRHSKGLLCLS